MAKTQNHTSDDTFVRTRGQEYTTIIGLILPGYCL